MIISVLGEVIQVSRRLSLPCICVQKTVEVAERVKEVMEAENNEDFGGSYRVHTSPN